MANSITEILKEANDAPTEIMKHAGNNYLRFFMETAYIPEKKMVLPEGEPPFKQNPQSEFQLVGAFWQIAKKIDIYRRTDLKPVRREYLFIQALESLAITEAKILLAAKDQTLYNLYPNLTLERLKEVGYFK